MFFLRNKVMMNTMLKNKRVFSNCNNNCCNLDIETKKKIQILGNIPINLY